MIDDEGRLAKAKTNQLDKDKIREAVNTAAEMVKYSEPDDGNYLYEDKEFSFIDWSFDKDTAESTLEEVIDFAQEIKNTAKNYDEKIKFATASVEVNEVKHYYANTLGIVKNSHLTYATTYLSVTATDGENSSMAYDVDVKRAYKYTIPFTFAREVSERAVKTLKSEILKTGKYDIIFSPYISSMFLNLLFNPLSGVAVYKNKSFLKEKIGEKISGDKITLLNDPLNGSSPLVWSYDHEGISTSRFPFIENGVLKTYAHNLYSAKKMDVKPTGNSVADFRNPFPNPAATNLHFVATHSKYDILKMPENGLYITNIMGLHTADPVSGRFSVQIDGFKIENGELTQPFKGMTLAGNLLELLSNIEAIGGDFKYMGSTAGSTMLIKSMSVGGK